MGAITIKFGVHNRQIKVYAIIGKERKNKSLSFFGDNYKVETSVDYWEKTNQCFASHISRTIPIPTAKEDNKRLEELKSQLEEFASIKEYSSCEGFFEAYKAANNVEATKVPTLLEYAKIYAQLCKTGNVQGKKHYEESGNYVLYEKFVRRLQGYQYRKIQPWAADIQVFANTPMTEIDNNSYNKFIYFLSTHDLPIKDSHNAFRTVVYYYRRWVMDDDEFRFQLKEKYKECVRISKTRKSKAQTLTTEQIKELARLDVKAVCPKMDDARKQLYKDTLLLMYGLVSRPFDILSMKIEDIKKKNGLYYWEYCANKMRNTRKRLNAMDQTPIEQGYWEIIRKYIGNRKKGFVLPFAINETEKPQQQRKIQINHTSVGIGKFLKAIASYYNWDLNVKGLSMYTLRHTAITDLLKSNPDRIVAAWAHTSVREINDTYEDRNNLAQSACPNTFKSLGI